MPTALIVLVFCAFIPYVLAVLGGYIRIKQLGRLDNKHPRIQERELSGSGARIAASQSNAWEALGLYTAVIFVCNVTGVAWQALEVPALIFALTRLLHPVLYILNIDVVRSINVVVGVICCAYMVAMAF